MYSKTKQLNRIVLAKNIQLAFIFTIYSVPLHLSSLILTIILQAQHLPSHFVY